MSRETQKQRLLGKLARGMAYTGPVFAVVIGASAFNVSAADVTAEPGYLMLAAGEAEAEGEAKKKGYGEGEAEGKGEAKGEAEGKTKKKGHGKDDGKGEGEGEAEGKAKS
ncbi:hypothetical protein [Marinobacter sp. 2_MG-2023]|uniref:hypothetical protein n=1 Tax=Marinobacter sp. 2_MG-2023 TaxID=3062679 RepID=UPI0026E435C7|nr:hypothetical protein [Marinobacter sp. 2_MG-2023]MDO6441924.1 hypothetical protein [Marinobacter sp. 2_MG-2023]